MKTTEKSRMTKKSPLENKSSENSPVHSSKIKERKCVQPAVLAIRTAALQDRPPTPTPGSSPSSYVSSRTEPFLAPIYIPNKLMANQKNKKSVGMSINQQQRLSTTRIREINPIAKAELRENTYRNGKADMALPAVDHISFPKLSNEDIKAPKRASFLPKIDQASQQTLTGLKRGSFHATTQHEHQLYGFKRSPLGRLEGNSIGSDIRLPAAKSKQHKSHVHKKVHKPDSRQKTGSTSLTSSPGSLKDINNTVHVVPKPPSLPKASKNGSKHPRRQHKANKIDSDISPSNAAEDTAG